MNFTFFGSSRRRTVKLIHIERIVGSGNYSLIYLVNEKPEFVALTLKSLHEQLPTFIRIHKQTLVNPQHIISYHLKGIHEAFVVLSNGERLPIARRRVKPLKEVLNRI